MENGYLCVDHEQTHLDQSRHSGYDLDRTFFDTRHLFETTEPSYSTAIADSDQSHADDFDRIAERRRFNRTSQSHPRHPIVGRRH